MIKRSLILTAGLALALANINVFSAKAMQEMSGKWEAKNGVWKYYDANGNMHKSWLKVGNKWYYFDVNTGDMLTKWQKIDGKWYFFDNTMGASSGAMLSGWQWIDGYCYYFGMTDKDLGSMYDSGTTPDGYMVNASGHWVEKNGLQHYQIDKGYSTKEVKKATTSTNRFSGHSGGGGGSHSYSSIPKSEMPKVEDNKKTDNGKLENNNANKNNKDMNTQELADGTWYGTGTWSRYYEQTGPDIVKVSIKDGKIEKVENIKYTEDESYSTKSLKILGQFVGQKDTKDILKQFKNKKGDSYDVISSATESAMGEVSAVDNALARSRKFKRDGIEQKIAYYDFKTRPNPQAKGTKLDLSMSVLKAYMTDGSTKDIAFSELGKYGIRTTPEHDSILPELGTTFLVNFINNEGLINMPAAVQVQKDYIRAYPDTLKVLYEDGKEKTIKLDESHFVYGAEFADSKVKSVSLYMKDKKVIDATYQSGRDVWEMSIKDVALPEGFDIWGFNTYQFKEHIDEANIPVKFDLLDKDESILSEDIKLPENIYVDGSAKAEDVEIEKKYENKWDKATFTIKAVNKAGKEVEATLDKEGDYLKVTFPKYRNAKTTITFLVKFKYVEFVDEEEVADEEEASTGEAGKTEEAGNTAESGKSSETAGDNKKNEEPEADKNTGSKDEKSEDTDDSSEEEDEADEEEADDNSEDESSKDASSESLRVAR